MALNKQKAYEAIIAIAEESKPVTVHIATSGYPEPEKFSYHGSFGAKKYLPDAVLEYDESCDIFSIEPSLSKKVLGESLHKWILFSSSAKNASVSLIGSITSLVASTCSADVGTSSHAASISKETSKNHRNGNRR